MNITIEERRRNLVESISRQGNMPDEACRDAFLQVPRHIFVPDTTVEEAYMDKAIITQWNDYDETNQPLSSSSQPSAMAIMLGQLRLSPGLKVLEIGAGSGYNAAIMAHIVGANNVITIDVDKATVRQARINLNAAGYGNVSVLCEDGWDGCSSGALFDRIIVTVGVPDIAPAWWQQLRDGGILHAPLSFQCAQLTVAFRKHGGCLTSEKISGCAFMDIRGKCNRCMFHWQTDGVSVIHDSMDQHTLDSIAAILVSPVEQSGITAGPYDDSELQNYLYYLALAHPLTLQLSGPLLAEQGIQGLTYGIVDLDKQMIATPQLCFGGHTLGTVLQRLAEQWMELGRPGIERLVISTCPQSIETMSSEAVDIAWRGTVRKEHSQFYWRYEV